MGLDKRDYMRAPREPGLRGRWAIIGAGDKIIVLNAVVFVLWQLSPTSFMADNFTVSWSGLFEHARLWTAITSAFSHHGFWHLLWNMVYLHLFAIELEQIYGRRNFVLLYLYSAVVASLAHVTWSRGWGFDVPALGASGAVMAVVVVAAIFYPTRTIAIWWIPMPLWLLATIKLLGDLGGLTERFGGGGVAHAAHLGGALAGVWFWWFDLRLFASPGQQEFLEEPGPSLRERFARLFRRVPVERGFDQDGARVDDLLRKIARDGMGALSEEELAFLKSASRRRR